MKYLGIDFGLKRIGLAISEGEIASPLRTLEVKNFKDAINKVLGVVESEGAGKVVVGLPEGKMGKTVLGFIKALRKSGLDVSEADETLSSQKATEQMIKQNIPRGIRRVNDSSAAAIILQEWLDENGVARHTQNAPFD